MTSSGGGVGRSHAASDAMMRVVNRIAKRVAAQTSSNARLAAKPPTGAQFPATAANKAGRSLTERTAKKAKAGVQEGEETEEGESTVLSRMSGGDAQGDANQQFSGDQGGQDRAMRLFKALGLIKKTKKGKISNNDLLDAVKQQFGPTANAEDFAKALDFIAGTDPDLAPQITQIKESGIHVSQKLHTDNSPELQEALDTYFFEFTVPDDQMDAYKDIYEGLTPLITRDEILAIVKEELGDETEFIDKNLSFNEKNTVGRLEYEVVAARASIHMGEGVIRAAQEVGVDPHELKETYVEMSTNPPSERGFYKDLKAKFGGNRKVVIDAFVTSVGEEFRSRKPIMNEPGKLHDLARITVSLRFLNGVDHESHVIVNTCNTYRKTEGVENQVPEFQDDDVADALIDVLGMKYPREQQVMDVVDEFSIPDELPQVKSTVTQQLLGGIQHFPNTVFDSIPHRDGIVEVLMETSSSYEDQYDRILDDSSQDDDIGSELDFDGNISDNEGTT
jgi:hypothetical protein